MYKNVNTLNKICSDEEYAAMGFSPREIPMIRRHDKLFNRYWLGSRNERQIAEMAELVRRLGL